MFITAMRVARASGPTLGSCGIQSGPACPQYHRNAVFPLGQFLRPEPDRGDLSSGDPGLPFDERGDRPFRGTA
jgi:hypothetical protein